MDPIGRKSLPHDPPLGIGTGGQLFLITICATDRAAAPLTRPDVPEMLLEAVRHRHESGIWYCHLVLIMPDHIHALLRIPFDGSLRRPISDWKRWTATQGGFTWQRDFFDHRLRAEESEQEKADYILQNPVRAGLVSAPDEWPYRWIATD